MEKTMDKIVALAKARGFVYPGSEIYGGLANTWDYGNLGVELKNNVKRAWWQKFIQESPYNVGVDCAILMNPQTWVASGHLGSFSDPLMDCKECHERFRADKIIEDFSQENGIELESSVDGWSQEEMMNFIKLTSVNSEHIMVLPPERCHFKSGDLVRVIAGAFTGVVGRVGRAAGQQRVFVVLEGLCNVATAYIPNDFIQSIDTFTR